MPHKLVFVIPHGRNTRAIATDALAHLIDAAQGMPCVFTSVIIVHLDREEAPAPGDVLPPMLAALPVEYRTPKFPGDWGLFGHQTVVVLNGGTTPQQWAISQAVLGAQAEAQDLRNEDKYARWPASPAAHDAAAATGCLVLDVQRDGAVVLHRNRFVGSGVATAYPVPIEAETEF